MPESSEKTKKQRPRNAPVSVVGIGASAGGVQALQQFFGRMPADSGLAFVVVMHLSPDHVSNLAEILQSRTEMPVVQVNEAVKVERDRVYVIPPNKHLSMSDSTLVLSPPQHETGRRITIDLFFRTLAEHYGQRALCIILSGTDSDGVIGLKHIKAQGGVTIAQEPAEAEHDSMPRHAIETGMVDWILPINAMPARLCDYVQNEKAITLPPERNGEEKEASLPDLAEGAGGGPLQAKETTDPDDEKALSQVLLFLRSQTGHDFAHYKRATLLRRIARRLQVNSLETLPAYLDFLRTHPDESRALLGDLLINVTHFFRDPNVFQALETNLSQLFTGKGPDDQLRVWVPACATGEEAYSVAILLCEKASRLETPPQIQVFATDIDEDAVRTAREGIYSTTIEADVSPERLSRYFYEYHGRYRIKKEVRELVLFAPHDLLRDSPFSRLDLISCRNLLIYLKPEAQHRALDIFHFGLRPGGLLVLGSAEGVNGDHTLFGPLDKQNRIYVRRNTTRLPMVHLMTKPRQLRKDLFPLVVPRAPVRPEREDVLEEKPAPKDFPPPQRVSSLSEMHARLIEEHGPPSVIVDENYDIVHLSARAGEYLRFTGGEPSANLLKLVDEALRLELRTALFRAAQTREPILVSGIRTQRDGKTQMADFRVWPLHAAESEATLFLVMLEERLATEDEKIAPTPPQPHEPVARHLEEELRQTRERLNSTVEHYETTNEELKAVNEELQAMNEEMRSATEELETSKEELQSVNEELTTLNQELKNNIEELNRANSDLQNLIESTDIATVFLDPDLRIKRYTPRAKDLFNLLPADMGRPLSDISTRLDYPALSDDAAGVLQTLEKIEREVSGANDNTYLARLSPYRTVDDRISGVVIAFIEITAAKRAEVALRKSEEEFHRGIEEAPIPMIMQAEDGQVLQISRTWTELTGYTKDEIPTFEAWLNKAYGFGGEDVRERVRQSFHGEAPLEQVEFDIVTRKGKRRTWSFSASPIGILHDGRRFIVGMATDITERKAAEEASRASEQRLQQMVNMPRVGVLTLDYAGVMLSANDAFLEMIGYDRKEFEKKRFNWRDFTPPEYVDPSLEVMTAVRETGRGGPYEKEYIRKDGTRIWLMFVASDLGDGTIAEYAVDINDRKRAEEAVRHAKDEMEQRVIERTQDLLAINAELERTMAQRQELERELLEISEREKRRVGEDLHDMICQELSATALFLKSTAKKLAKDSPAAAKTLEESAETVNRNVVIARELASGLQAIELTASGLKNALRDLAAQACQNTGIKCHFKAARGVRIPDNTVALHLYRVAQEAVTNAVKHSGAKNILISLDHDKTHVCVNVQDDGKGFTAPKRRKGKGLGLHMMRYRANALGGELKIERRKTGGMHVICKIPTKR